MLLLHWLLCPLVAAVFRRTLVFCRTPGQCKALMITPLSKSVLVGDWRWELAIGDWRPQVSFENFSRVTVSRVSRLNVHLTLNLPSTTYPSSISIKTMVVTVLIGYT